jgi:hypothetical protein
MVYSLNPPFNNFEILLPALLSVLVPHHRSVDYAKYSAQYA